MMTIQIGDRVYGIPPQLVIKAIQDQMPDWLMGKVKAEGKQAIVKSGIKAVLPTMMSLGHADMVKHGSTAPAPNLRSPEAKADMIGYCLSYILFASLQAVDTMQLIAEYEVMEDGTIIPLGVTPTNAPLALAAPEDEHRAVG